MRSDRKAIIGQPQRDVYPQEPGIVTATATSFRVGSYNVLASAYVRADYYPHVDPAALRWETRRLALADRLERLDADVICLQEVDADAYALFADRLSTRGYAGIHALKGQGKPDGCAVFHRPGPLIFLGSEALYFHDGRGVGPDTGHLALIADFACALGVVRIAGVHLKWDAPGKAPEQHLGYRQVRELIDDLVLADRAAAGWIVCGDFNAGPDSCVVGALLDAGFADAYRDREQPTCNPNRTAKRIDFLLYTAGLAAVPDRLTQIDGLTPLPSADEPSDHLAVAARFATLQLG